MDEIKPRQDKQQTEEASQNKTTTSENNYSIVTPELKTEESPGKNTNTQYQADVATQTIRWRDVFRQPTLSNWIVATATVVIAAANIFFAIYASQQLDQIRSGSKDTKAVADTAKIQATAALEQVNELKASAKAAQDSADAAKRSAEIAERTLKFSDDSFRMTMRPYVVPRGVDIIDIVVGKPLSLRVKYDNTGRTPAVELTLKGRIHFGLQPLPEVIDESSLEILDTSVSVIGSNAGLGSRVIGKSPLQKVSYDGLQTGAIRMFAEGIIRYRDVFTNQATKRLPSYQTRYCYRYDPTIKAMSYCSTNNFMK